MRCRVCDGGELVPLWVDAGGNQWSRCALCGSDTSSGDYPAALYTDEYLTGSLARTGGMDEARSQVRSLIEWFGHYRKECGGKDFLDVGCLEGAALDEAAAHDWSVHGWDRIAAAARPGCTTITPHFAAGFFPQQYHAVLCKDVIEHAPGWRGFLAELTAVTVPNGLLLIQTPRPMDRPDPTCYQPAHLFIVAPPVLERAAVASGFTVLDRREWEGTATGPAGQAWLLRKTDGM